MKHLRVPFKILLQVVVAFIAMAILGWESYVALTKAGLDMTDMYTQKLKSVQLLGNCIDSMRVIQVRTYQAIADPPRAAEVKKGMEKSLDKYEAQWNEYTQVVANVPDAQAGVQQAGEHWRLFRKSLTQTMNIAATGNSVEALADYNKSSKQAVVYLRDDLHRLLEGAEQRAEAIHKQNDTANQESISFIIQLTIGAMVVLIALSIYLIRSITAPLNATINECQLMQAGDLRHTDTKDIDRRDEFGDMLRALHEVRKNLRHLTRTIIESGDKLSSSASGLSGNSSQTAKASASIADSVSEATSVVNKQVSDLTDGKRESDDIYSAIQTLDRQASQVVESAQQTSAKAVSSIDELEASVQQIRNVESTVKETAELVDKLGERSKEIGSIVDTITGIAGQTNLLALNAAIEAARAGEAGRGFAVVAEEVRKLAEQSQQAAQQIAQLITGIQVDTENAVVSMQEGCAAVVEGAQSVEALKESFAHIKGNIDNVADTMMQVKPALADVLKTSEGIAQRMTQIQDDAHDVSGKMQTVSAATQEQSAASEEIASSSDTLAVLAQDLHKMLGSFKV